MTWLPFIQIAEVCKKVADVFLREFAVAGSFQEKLRPTTVPSSD